VFAKIGDFNFSLAFVRKAAAYLMGLYHPLDGLTNPKYNLLCFLTTKIFLGREEGTSF
jgi:hypothetical protein